MNFTQIIVYGGIPVIIAIMGFLVTRVEKILGQVRLTNGRVNLLEQEQEAHTSKINGLETRERERLQAEVVEARATRRVRK